MLLTYVITPPALTLATSIIFLSTILTLSATNWIIVWIIIELNLLRFLPLIVINKTALETEAAVKYFLSQALGSATILLRRISIWYSHSTLIELILLMALLLKMGAAPCHFWYPSTLTAISWILAVYLSTWQKLAPLVALTFFTSTDWTNILLTVGTLNALLGGRIGINQSHIRTILAYSSIGHIGWIIALIAINKSALTIIYFAIYSIILIPVFTLLVILDIDNPPSTHTQILIHIKFWPPLAILLLSIGGIPPLTGFVPKLLTIIALAPHAPITTILLIIGSLINLYFYLLLTFNVLIINTKPSLNPIQATPDCTGYYGNVLTVTATIGIVPLIL